MIDLGCGEGRFSRMLAERSAVVTGIDLCRPLIEFAKSHRVYDESYLIGDMEDLHGVASDEFDLAVSYVSSTSRTCSARYVRPFESCFPAGDSSSAISIQ